MKHLKRTIAVSLALASLTAFSISISAQSQENSVVQPQKASFVGLIESIKETNTLFGNKQNLTATIVKEDGQRITLNLNKHTAIIDHETSEPAKLKHLKDGQLIFFAYPTDSAISGETPSLSPEVVVILSEKSTDKLKFDIFDSNGLSSDGSLRITLTEQTKITTKSNKPISIDKAIGKPMLVFFNELTLPSHGEAPQTIPTRVIVVGKKG